MDCASDIVSANEQVGAYLKQIIQPGSWVYWDGGLSAVPLLYVPGIHIFPPQLNDGYAFRIGGDSDLLFKQGYWNEQLKDEWIQRADVFIIEGWRYSDWKEILTPNHFSEYPRPPIDLSCRNGSGLRIFKRIE